jgi:hypothetical protein
MFNYRKFTDKLSFGKIQPWIFLSLITFALIQYISNSQLLTISVPKVYFQIGESTINESVPAVNIAVSLSTTSQQRISIDYLIVSGTANQTNHGSGKDYAFTQETLIFPPGTLTQNISIAIIDDSINETDENLEIQLVNATHATLADKNIHHVRILDNDRQNIVSVREFGAKGDSINDDTKAIQSAIDQVYQQGGGVILFPAGVYLVTSVTLKENITYYGYGATIKRPDKQEKWTRTFTTDYAGKEDSQPLIIQGLTFDGNSKNQGQYQDYELEQAHLIFLIADPKFPGKLRAFIEDCTFKNGVADGISVYTNVAVKINNCQAIDVFRGGFVLTGGNSVAEVYNLTTSGKVDATGIDIEVDGRGYGETLKVDVKFENLNLINGDFDIAVDEGSTVTGNNIVSGDSPFLIFSLNSQMKFTNCKFTIGAADSYVNRILFPHNVTFENCEFIVTRKVTTNPHDFFAGADVWWQHPNYSLQKNQILTFNNCAFKVDKNFRKTDKIYAIYLREDAQSRNNRLIINGGNISPDFQVPIFRE